MSLESSNQLFPNQSAFLTACQRGDRRAQKELFDRLRAKMFVVCLRYADNREDAEDILQEGFVKVFKDLHQFRGEGSVEGWIRKVFVNTALLHLRKRKNSFQVVELHEAGDFGETDESIFYEEHLTSGVIRLMQQLPAGFRTVLNLYVLEGFSHKEIAEMLGISEGTSKSQLMRGKEFFKRLLEKHLVK